MNSRVLPDLRMVGHVSGSASVAHRSLSVASGLSFDRVSSDDQENGDVDFAPLQKSFALESKNG